MISNQDIEVLLHFCVKELGSYKLIYKDGPYRKQFILISVLTILAGVFFLGAFLCLAPPYSIIVMLLSCFSIIACFFVGNHDILERYL